MEAVGGVLLSTLCFYCVAITLFGGHGRGVLCHQEHENALALLQRATVASVLLHDVESEILQHGASSEDAESNKSKAITNSLLKQGSNLQRHEMFPSVQLQNVTESCRNRSVPVISFGIADKFGLAGGFGDRLRGMVTTYYLAVMTNSSFAVNWTRPYDLNDYFFVPGCGSRAGVNSERFEPSGDGSLGGGMVVGDSPATSSLPDLPRESLEKSHEPTEKITRFMVGNDTYFTESLFSSDLGKDLEIQTNSFCWKDVVRNPAFGKEASTLGLSTLSQAQLFKLAIDELLGNPRNLVNEAFESVMRRLAGSSSSGSGSEAKTVSYVGVQIRLGGRNGDASSVWEDPPRHSLEQVQCFAMEAVRLCRDLRINSIFVTADSDEAVRVFEGAVTEHETSASSAAESAAGASSSASSSSASASPASDSDPSLPPLRVVHVPGAIAHTDLSDINTDRSRGVWLKSILDWWVLKHAAALVVSRSSYGLTAASSSDAAIALRLKFTSSLATEGAPLSPHASAPSGGSQCEFEEILQNDKDVFFKGFAIGGTTPL